MDLLSVKEDDARLYHIQARTPAPAILVSSPDSHFNYLWSRLFLKKFSNCMWSDISFFFLSVQAYAEKGGLDWSSIAWLFSAGVSCEYRTYRSYSHVKICVIRERKSI